jgi:predicted N-acetyltransferase YhbS
MGNVEIRNIRPEDHESLQEMASAIAAEVGSTNSGFSGMDDWRWKYLDPGFESVIVVAEDAGRLVGSYHLLSRPARVRGEPRTLVAVQDLAVLSEYRRQGLFRRLSSVGSEQLAELGWDLSFALPTRPASYLGFTRHLGYTDIKTVPVYIRPLRPGNILAAKLPVKPLWKALGAPARWAYDLLFPLGRSTNAMDTKPIERFPPDVEPISDEFLVQAGNGSVRDAAFLNWRFVDDPAKIYQRWGAYRGDRLLAYAVLRRARLFRLTFTVLMDMGCRNDEETALLNLIGHRVKAAVDDGADVAMTLGLHPFFKRLRRLGFLRVPRLVSPRKMNFLLQAHTDRARDESFNPDEWLLTPADWDVL